MRETKNQAEGELRLTEPWARLLVENAADGVYALDTGGKCLWSNQAAARIFGYDSPSAYVGRQMHEVIHHTRADGTPYPESECTGLQQLRAGEPILQPQELLWRADGTSFYAEVRVNPIAPDGEVTGAVVVLRDLTERLQAEEQMRRALKMEAVGRLAAGIAHDFNNLLMVINGFAELLQQQPELAGVAAQRLAGIGRAGERAAELTRQLLAFSRQQEMHPGVVDLNQWLREVADTVQDALGKGLRLHLDLDPAVPPVEMDGGCLEQVLINLAVNARDAMPTGGTLRLRTRRMDLEEVAARRLGVGAGAYALLSVSDTGKGMDRTAQQRIFEPFFTTKPVGQGSGLGLAMVLGVVEQSGGAVRVESEPGRGAEFQIYLPAAAAPAGAAEGEPERETILLVMEDGQARSLALEGLLGLGYAVVTAVTAARGREMGRRRGVRVRLLVSGAGPLEAELAAELLRQHTGMKMLCLGGDEDARSPKVPPGAVHLPGTFTATAVAAAAAGLLPAAAPTRAGSCVSGR